MNIGTAAERSGVSAKAIRYYESIGLIGAAARGANNYRAYGERDVAALRFVAAARAMGFTIARIKALLRLWQDRGRPSAAVKRIAHEHLREIDRRIAELTALRHALDGLVRRCHGDERPDCAILDGLARSGDATGTKLRRA